MRKIIHIDMDCFYAAVEMRDNPRLANQSIAVGGRPDRRGVIATCNYAAREYGVHSAMPSSQARKLCPELIILPPNLKKYREVSKQIQGIYKKYTEVIEPLSLDEVYLDVSNVSVYSGSATLIARAIKQDIRRTVSLTASAGVAPNKFLAKVASDWEKPNGLTVITPEQVPDFVFHLPVKKIHGVGKVTNKKLANMGIRTCGELQEYSQQVLIDKFGRFGVNLYQYARGIDERRVSSHSERKSISVETTFSEDLYTQEECTEKLPDLLTQLSKRISHAGDEVPIHKLFVKLKFSDFTSTTVETIDHRLNVELLKQLLEQAKQRSPLPVRLMGIGIRVKSSDASASEQLELPFH